MPADFESYELLRAVARKNDAGTIYELAGQIHDWDALLALAQEHRVLPMLYSRLEGAGSVVPLTVQQRLRTEYERNMFHNLANAAELLAVLQALKQEAIHAMPFKGVVLGAAAYHDLTTRAAGDLDILIRASDIVKATAVLRERGYQLLTDSHIDGVPLPNCYEFRFERPADGMVLELRWRLALTEPRFRRDLGIDWVWPQRRTIMLAGGEVPDISPEFTLLILCMHGSRHAWSRLLWICDVAQLIEASPKIDWEQVVREAKKQGLRRSLALGVLLARRIAGVPIPQNIEQRFASDAVAHGIAQYIEEHLFDAPGSTPPGRVPYNLQLLDFPDRARAFFSLDSLRPNERDRAAFPLPKPLGFLYYLIRPLRLLKDRSARW